MSMPLFRSSWIENSIYHTQKLATLKKWTLFWKRKQAEWLSSLRPNSFLLIFSVSSLVSILSSNSNKRDNITYFIFYLENPNVSILHLITLRTHEEPCSLHFRNHYLINEIFLILLWLSFLFQQIRSSVCPRIQMGSNGKRWSCYFQRFVHFQGESINWQTPLLRKHYLPWVSTSLVWKLGHYEMVGRSLA